MIDNNEIIQILNNLPSINVICNKFEFRPSFLADDIVRLANTVKNYGYILIGVTSSKTGYNIIGLSQKININGILDVALKKISVSPKIEYKEVSIVNKTIYVLKIYKVEGGTSLDDKKIEDPNIMKFIIDLCSALEKMQKNQLYINASEDQRNDYIRDILETLGYNVKDQTRTGLSNNGKDSGEADLKVIINNNLETIIESLNLTNLNKEYLDIHIDKIYKYDSNGNVFNCCVTYAQILDFAVFYTKYYNHIKNHIFEYPLLSIKEITDELNLPADIKVMVSKHNRSGKLTLLYHVCVKIQSKKINN